MLFMYDYQLAIHISSVASEFLESFEETFTCSHVSTTCIVMSAIGSNKYSVTL